MSAPKLGAIAILEALKRGGVAPDEVDEVLMGCVLQGGIGAVIALVGLVGGFLVVRSQYLAPLASAVNVSTIRFLPAEFCLFLVIGGMAVGCLGGLVAASRE